MNIEEIAKKMVSKGRGILAADESTMAQWIKGLKVLILITTLKTD